MASIKHYIQRIKEGRLKQLIGELLWMYAYVRRYWLLIGVYVLLGASGSCSELGYIDGQPRSGRCHYRCQFYGDRAGGVYLCGRRRGSDLYQCGEVQAVA